MKKFLPFYCSGSFYGEMEKEKDKFGNRKNCQIIFLENSAWKKELDLQSGKGK